MGGRLAEAEAEGRRGSVFCLMFSAQLFTVKNRTIEVNQGPSLDLIFTKGLDMVANRTLPDGDRGLLSEVHEESRCSHFTSSPWMPR